MGKFLLFVIIVGGVFGGIYVISKKRPLSEGRRGVLMQITSPKFANNSKIPALYTCSGQNVNPPLFINSVPADTQSLVLVMDDPDAPNGNFTHWVVYNIPPTTTEIKENTVPPGITAANSTGARIYTGPCPPSGEHRYYFKIYALNIVLQSGSIRNKQDLQEAIKGHILDDAELLGRFSKTE